MSTYTPNYNLEKPDSGDDFKDFRSNYNSNMDIIDQNLGGGGSSVSWQQLQVTGDKIATIRVSGIDTDVFTPNSQTFTMAVSRININSDETYPTVFGKIKKWFNDLKTVAFSGSYNDLSDQPTIVSDVEVNGSSVVSGGVAEITPLDNVNQTYSFTVGDNDNDLRGELKIQNGLSALPATATIRTNTSQISDLTFQLPSQSGTLALQNQNIDYFSVVNGAVNITYLQY